MQSSIADTPSSAEQGHPKDNEKVSVDHPDLMLSRSLRTAHLRSTRIKVPVFLAVSLTSGLPLRSLEDALQLKRTWLVCPDSNCDTLKVLQGLLGRRSHCGKRTLEVVDVECKRYVALHILNPTEHTKLHTAVIQMLCKAACMDPAGVAGGLFWLNIWPGSLPPQSDPRYAGIGWTMHVRLIIFNEGESISCLLSRE